jgi:hypothetical protein
MKKRTLLCNIMLSFLYAAVFAQQVETITYFDGTLLKTFTVKAKFVGWIEDLVTISGAGTQSAQMISYSTWIPTLELAAESGVAYEWSEWERNGTDPKPYADVNVLIAMRDAGMRLFREHQNFGYHAGNILKIATAPSNRPAFIWFNENNNLYAYYKLYIVVP